MQRLTYAMICIDRIIYMHRNKIKAKWMNRICRIKFMLKENKN